MLKYVSVRSTEMFQSLSGFQVRCNAPTANMGGTNADPFQSLSGFQVRCNIFACRVSNLAGGFQSLSGFQVRCNAIESAFVAFWQAVSIPVGFSSPLQPFVFPKQSLPMTWFQSLSGFQVRCNSGLSRKEKLELIRFNPCRVFKSAATQNHRRRWNLVFRCFNPCRVFKSAATAGATVLCAVDLVVSIPVGFSSPLQQTA